MWQEFLTQYSFYYSYEDTLGRKHINVFNVTNISHIIVILLYIWRYTLERNNTKCRHYIKVFWQKGNLISHLKIYTEEIAYQCTLCDKVFQIKVILDSICGHTLGRTYINAVNVRRLSHIIVLLLDMWEYTEKKLHEFI